MNELSKQSWWSKHEMDARIVAAAAAAKKQQVGKGLSPAEEEAQRLVTAAMSAAFLLAAADGSVSGEEYDQLVDTFETTLGLDRDMIETTLTGASALIESEGLRALTARTAELTVDPRAREPILLFALATAMADRELSDDEMELVTALGAALGVPADRMRELVAAARV